MRNAFLLAAFGASCSVATFTLIAPAFAGTANPTPAAAGPTAQDDPSRRVCRRIQPTGSRLATRICKSQNEWDAIARAAQDGMQESERNDSVQHNPECNLGSGGSGC